MCTFGLSGCRVKSVCLTSTMLKNGSTIEDRTRGSRRTPQKAPKPPGFHTTTREPKRVHLRVPVFKNTTKIQRKGPTREGEKNKNCGGREKKSEILGGPAEGGPAERP